MLPRVLHQFTGINYIAYVTAYQKESEIVKQKQ
jgi:hypothetical protein